MCPGMMVGLMPTPSTVPEKRAYEIPHAGAIFMKDDSFGLILESIPAFEQLEAEARIFATRYTYRCIEASDFFNGRTPECCIGRHDVQPPAMVKPWVENFVVRVIMTEEIVAQCEYAATNARNPGRCVLHIPMHSSRPRRVHNAIVIGKCEGIMLGAAYSSITRRCRPLVSWLSFDHEIDSITKSLNGRANWFRTRVVHEYDLEVDIRSDKRFEQSLGFADPPVRWDDHR